MSQRLASGRLVERRKELPNTAWLIGQMPCQKVSPASGKRRVAQIRVVRLHIHSLHPDAELESWTILAQLLS